jgi:hypothetical protein
MAALTLEAGKRYVARCGMVTTPIEIETGDIIGATASWPVAAELGNRFDVWRRDGRYQSIHYDHPFDLVAEYVETDALAA